MDSGQFWDTESQTVAANGHPDQRSDAPRPRRFRVPELPCVAAFCTGPSWSPFGTALAKSGGFSLRDVEIGGVTLESAGAEWARRSRSGL